jgi:DNA-binding SARP family transcriptional activator
VHPRFELRQSTTENPNRALEFRVLGRLEVLKAGRPVQLGGGRQRALLAVLLLHANEAVSSDLLIEELWGPGAPDTAAKMIQNNVSQLRRLLEPEQVLVTRARGYELRIDPDQLDANRFARLAKEAKQTLADGAASVAAAKLREALGIWRGRALADFTNDVFAQGEIARLEELRLAALEDRIDADLACGRQADLVGELEALVAQYPLRERLRAHLMLALYRSGRQAEALEVYQSTRQFLVERLGIEPSRSLQRLERAILLQDPSLDFEQPPEPQETQPPEPAPAHEVRKTVSVVSAEVVPLGPRLDPEALRGPMSRALEVVSSVLERHGGSVERAGTGAVVAVFGIPLVHEDDPLRAVRATFELEEALTGLNRELERRWRIRMTVRAAVNTGEVVARDAPAGDRVVAGDALDVAARILQAADSAEILIADATRRLLAHSIQAEAVEPLGLKGTPELLRAWRLVDVSAGATAIERRLEAPMVGRESELAELGQAFDRAVRERTPYLFTILGPAGIGKSRLAAEFARSVDENATALSGRCLPYGEAVTFWPLAEIVRQVVGDDARDGIAALLGGRADAILIADRIASAIGADETARPSEETFWAARKLFEALARDRPLVLVFEDLHWAEPTLLELVDHIAEWAREAPMLLVCLARPELIEERPTWGGGKTNATSILLGPLSDRESQLLMKQLGGAAELPETAVDGIVKVAEGNPLFLEEMLAMLNEASSADDLAIPPTIQAVLAARLDRLGAGERAVLERASIIGKEFWRAAVIELLPEGAGVSVDGDLRLLVRRELIRPHRSLFSGDEAFRFRHILLREAAYASIPKEARAELHERYAGWLEQAAGSRAREFEEIVGHHLEQAYRYRAEIRPADYRARELAARAAEQLARAGRRAYARDDLPAAVGLLSRAAALLEARAPGRTDLLVDLAEALRETGDLERADAVLVEAGEAAAVFGDPAREWHVRIARLRLQLQMDPEVKTEEVLRDASRAVEVFEPLGDDRRLAEAWALLAWVPWFRCEAAAAETALQRAVEHAGRAGDSRTGGQSLNLLIGAAWFGPLPVSEAVRRCEEILAQSAEQRRVTASALRALAGLKAMEGDFGAARELIDRHRALLEDLGFSVTAAHAAETYGIVELLSGDAAAAEREFRRGYETLERMGGEMNVSPLAALLAQALYIQERDEEALRFSELSEEEARPDDLFAHVQWRSARAKVLARAGQHEQAERLAREAVRLSEQTDFLAVRGDTLMDLAEVLRLGGRVDEARAPVEEALRLYEAKGNVVSAARARRLLTDTAEPIREKGPLAH